jgi:hypothetical protein
MKVNVYEKYLFNFNFKINELHSVLYPFYYLWLKNKTEKIINFQKWLKNKQKHNFSINIVAVYSIHLYELWIKALPIKLTIP